MTKGDIVEYINYGAIKRGTVERVANGLVWLTSGKWLHTESCKVVSK